MIADILGLGLIFFGLFFFVVGVLGILRLPDAYSRLHATGKVATVGLFGLLVGSGFLMPELLPRLILLSLFFLLTGPTASHVISLSQHRKETET